MYAQASTADSNDNEKGSIQLPPILRDYNIVSLATNLPGPIAAKRLADMGASVTKVEPPSGDLLAHAIPEYYEWLKQGQRTMTLDLKDEQQSEKFHDLLSDADLLITATRPEALQRLGLGWEELTDFYPRLCQVAIVGHSGEDADRAGHDLTYQASTGTLTPPTMPLVPIADLAGAEHAVQSALALLLARDGHRRIEVSRAAWHDSTRGGYHEVPLATAAESYARPAMFGLTGEGSPLGGALPGYKIYPAAEGYIAVAVLEPHFQQRMNELLEINGSAEQIAEAMVKKTAEEWEQWGIDNDVPVAEVRKANALRDDTSQ